MIDLKSPGSVREHYRNVEAKAARGEARRIAHELAYVPDRDLDGPTGGGIVVAVVFLVFLALGFVLASSAEAQSDPLCNGATVEDDWEIEAPWLQNSCALVVTADRDADGRPLATGSHVTVCDGVDGMAWAGTYRASAIGSDACRVRFSGIGGRDSLPQKEIPEVRVVYMIGDSGARYDPRHPGSVEEACSMAGVLRDSRRMLFSQVADGYPIPYEGDAGGLGVRSYFICQAHYDGDLIDRRGRPYLHAYDGREVCLSTVSGPAASQHDCDGPAGIPMEWIPVPVQIEAEVIVDPSTVPDGPSPSIIAEDTRAAWRRGGETGLDGSVTLIRR